MVNLTELIPELKDCWELRENGGYFKPTDYGWFEKYFLATDEKFSNGEPLVEIGFYSKVPFKHPETLERRFKWHMGEFNIDEPITCVERADGWYMFVKHFSGFPYFYGILCTVGTRYSWEP